MEADKIQLFKARFWWKMARLSYALGLERLGDRLMDKAGRHLCNAFWMIDDSE